MKNPPRTATPPQPPECAPYTCGHASGRLTHDEVLAALREATKPEPVLTLTQLIMKGRGCTAFRTNGLLVRKRLTSHLNAMAEAREIILTRDAAAYFAAFGSQPAPGEADVHFAALPEVAERARAAAAQDAAAHQRARLACAELNARLSRIGFGELAHPTPNPYASHYLASLTGEPATLGGLLDLAELGHRRRGEEMAAAR
jgi:hypothetical protein